jgi:hypothetical protein
VSTAFGIGSAMALRAGNSAYVQYQASRTARDAISNYGHASDLRRSARLLATVSGVMWGAAALEAAVAEWKHGKMVNDVRGYGAR